MQKYHAFFMSRRKGLKRTNKDSVGLGKKAEICKKNLNFNNMIQTKIFSTIRQVNYPENLETWINNFLSENDVELIDIKFSTVQTNNGFVMSAMIIYKAK